VVFKPLDISFFFKLWFRGCKYHLC